RRPRPGRIPAPAGPRHPPAAPGAAAGHPGRRGACAPRSRVAPAARTRPRRRRRVRPRTGPGRASPAARPGRARPRATGAASVGGWERWRAPARDPAAWAWGLQVSCGAWKRPAGNGGRPHSNRRIQSRPPPCGPAIPQGVPMASYGMNDVKNGMKILVNNEPAVITDTEYVKPGKGQAFTRVKYRQIRTGRVQEVTMKSTDSLEAADVVDTDMQYLYSDGEYWHFMQQESFEQVQADKAGVGDAAKWLKGEEECVVTLYNGSPIQVTPPNF